MRQQRGEPAERRAVPDRGRAQRPPARRPARRPRWAARRPYRPTTTMTRAARSRSSLARIRCSPATPTSTTSSACRPRCRAVRGPRARPAGRTCRPRRRAPGRRTAPAARPARPAARSPRRGAASGSSAAPPRRAPASARVNRVRGRRRAQRGGDRRDLRRRLARAVDRLGIAAAARPVEVQVGEPGQAGPARPTGVTECDGHQRQGERAGLDPGQVDGDEPESGRPHGRADPRAQRLGRRPDQVVGGQLDPGDVAVVADPAVAEAERAQRRPRPPRSGPASPG